jgi:hypothetical protein
LLILLGEITAVTLLALPLGVVIGRIAESCCHWPPSAVWSPWRCGRGRWWSTWRR